MLAPPETAMVLGLGSIGLTVAGLLRGLGLFVRGTSRSGTQAQRLGCDEFVAADCWREYLPQTDILLITLPHNADTHHCIGAAELACLRRGAVLVNVARPKIVDINALQDALFANHLGGAALDGLDPVPAKNDPIWSVPNLLLTPKIAAFHPEMQSAFESFATLQVANYLAGAALQCVVGANE